MRTLSGPLSLSFALALACGCVPVEYSGTVAVTTPTPDLAYVGPGVHVIADYDEPIFFSGGFYWWPYGGAWYRSATYTGGWEYVVAPPIAIVRLQEPYRYRHYRPAGYVVHHRPVPAHRVHRPVVRDHRR